MAKQKFYLSIDRELYHRLLQILQELDITMSDLLKIISRVQVNTVQLSNFSGKNTRVAYYAFEPLLHLNKGNINYKILKFIEVFENSFIN